MKLLYKIVSAASSAYVKKPGIRQGIIRNGQFVHEMSTKGNTSDINEQPLGQKEPKGNTSDINEQSLDQKGLLQAATFKFGHAVRVTVVGLGGAYALFMYVSYARAKFKKIAEQHAKEEQQKEALSKQVEDLRRNYVKNGFGAFLNDKSD